MGQEHVVGARRNRRTRIRTHFRLCLMAVLARPRTSSRILALIYRRHAHPLASSTRDAPPATSERVWRPRSHRGTGPSEWSSRPPAVALCLQRGHLYSTFDDPQRCGLVPTMSESSDYAGGQDARVVVAVGLVESVADWVQPSAKFSAEAIPFTLGYGNACNNIHLAVTPQRRSLGADLHDLICAYPPRLFCDRNP